MLKKIAMTSVLAGAVALTGIVAPAASDAAPPAGARNCVSVLTSTFGPQQQVDDAVHVLQQLAAQSGMTFGEVARALAGQRGNLSSCLGLLGLG